MASTLLSPRREKSRLVILSSYLSVMRTAIAVADIVDLYAADAAKQDLLQRVSELAALPENWRAYFRKRLWKPDA